MVKITKKINIIPGSPNTLIYDGRIVIDRNNPEIQGEVQLATHGHADHISGLLSNAKVKYLPKEEYWSITLQGRRMLTYGCTSLNSEIFSYDYVKENLVDLTADYKDSEVESIKLPGHTPGHTGYIVDNVLYAGDTFFGERVLQNFSVPFYIDFWSALDSIQKIKEISKSVENVVISHGPIFSLNKMIKLIDYNIEYNNKLVERVKELISTEEMTSEEIAIRLKPDISATGVLLNSITIKSMLLGLENIEYKVTPKGLVFRKKVH
ncbi:MBL fold metallo-hydrolase [Sulfolobus acidocaldarius]|uniref:Conserved Crenarchaeal protein n=4 Tax=Sulfolobus acidocaldarius TaxID=2285 RepID=Q4J9D1_SULAC|nr:MBL fold metallo-hydrolase [Sulfolobus acidocaldarius]AAY80599.1 conserved Crenarchaeal protein [Sulfolobus acidocaldarius DSM 639]AGE71189.1 hypothetical protein SacN8_06120 [Sulfolobus acidocaldarius N8]AGE73459.1 hypothetical protein SacRon12I_06115 [Sulfolobus acidocaldarius Ron12/I]ALU28545.1 MBL fold metallo-hydrolase [Sulfolobus acidocaldarius]ALU31256.1 MBL fold metallo-hydrolase [Sulfolobus acidocaldarius]